MVHKKRFLVASFVAASGLLASCGGGDDGAGSSAASGDPELIAEGKTYYEGTCAACHGIDLKGTATGPPFLDPVYAPGHHPDAAFFTAVEFGVKPHHWDFGAMPPQQHISDEQVEAIVAYVRSEQMEAGITDDSGH